MEKLIALSVALICGTCIFMQAAYHNQRLDQIRLRNVNVLGERLEEELAKIAELKTKIDTIALKVGLR